MRELPTSPAPLLAATIYPLQNDRYNPRSFPTVPESAILTHTRHKAPSDRYKPPCETSSGPPEGTLNELKPCLMVGLRTGVLARLELAPGWAEAAGMFAAGLFVRLVDCR